MRRRQFLKTLTAAAGSGIVIGADDRLQPFAIQSGDVTPSQATIWARSPKGGQMEVRWRTTEAVKDIRTVRGPVLSAATDFTGRVNLSGLPAGQRIFYEVHAEGVEALRGHLDVPSNRSSNLRFLWSGDMVGQGWGINPEFGGCRIFETMRKLEPDFFIHSGDSIYADGPVASEVKLADGKVWKNIVTGEKSKVAETLDEFRGCYRYNLLDENVRRFSAQVPQIWQWDDHEVMNNWSPSKNIADDNRYKEKNVQALVDRARQAYLEYAPLRLNESDARRIYRRIPYGPLLDVFVVDMRSYRGPNSYNRQETQSAETVFLGKQQMDWLKRDLRASRATWKVIAADMPVGLVVPDGKDAGGRTMYEAIANGNGPALGRELEIAGLLSYMKRHKIRNTVWLTADVHYTAAHHYDPGKARFTEFLPFWEFVSGPLNAGTFGPGVLDDTFGPQVVFQKAPPKGQSNLPPSAGYQFFGDVQISAKTRELTVTLRDLSGIELYSKALAPERG
jgi:alkaline phosphatase D